MKVMQKLVLVAAIAASALLGAKEAKAQGACPNNNCSTNNCPDCIDMDGGWQEPYGNPVPSTACKNCGNIRENGNCASHTYNFYTTYYDCVNGSAIPEAGLPKTIVNYGHACYLKISVGPHGARCYP